MLKNTPRPIRGLSVLTTLTVLLALWIAIPRVACAELRDVALDLEDRAVEALDPVEGTARAIRRLEPRTRQSSVDLVAAELTSAAQELRFDPRLLVALTHYESRFRFRAVSRADAVGIMQVKRGGYALRWAPPGCRARQMDPACSIRTGSGYLAALRDRFCPGSTWRWVTAYSRRSCPSERSARSATYAREVRARYCLVRSDCRDRWPE